MTRWATIALFLSIAREISAVRRRSKCHQKIGLCLADTANKCGRNLGEPSAQNESIARRFDRSPDHREIVNEIAGGAHIAASAPGGTAPLSRASGIGLIGLTGATGTVLLGPSVL